MFSYDRLAQGLTQWILMTPAYPEVYGTARSLFQSAETADTGLLLHTKRERAREWEMAVTANTEKTTNPNPTFTQTESL